MNRRLKMLFWVCYVAFPLLSGSFAYPWGHNESFDASQDILLSTRPAENENGNIVKLPDIWQNRETGKIYRYDDFHERRFTEAVLNGVKSLIYAAIGTCFYAVSDETLSESERSKPWIIGLIIWVVFVALIFAYA